MRKLSNKNDAQRHGRISLTGSDLFSPYLVPFSLTPERSEDGGLRIIEDGSGAVRVLRRSICWGYLGIPLAGYITFIVVGGKYNPMDVLRAMWGPHGLVLLIVPLGLLWLSTLHRNPTREVRFGSATSDVELRILRRGQCVRVFRYSQSQWSIRIHPVRLWSRQWPHAEISGFAAIGDLGPNRIALAFSQRRERIIAYVAGLPESIRGKVSEDETIVTGAAVTGGNIRG